jgi:hypothetical protein
MRKICKIPKLSVRLMLRAAVGLLIIPLVVPTAELTPVASASSSSYSPGNLISDSLFSAKDSMSVSDIQAFLVSKGSVLADLPSSHLGDGANGRSAAKIIYDASRASVSSFGGSNRPSNPFTVSLNPQVILVTLQKETSLITGSYTPGSSTLNNLLRIAMGYGCPDSGGCDAQYAGFTNQVNFASAQLWLDMWRAQNNKSVSYHVGSTYTSTNNPIYSPYCTTPNITFTVATAATSALYKYTPHVCNGNANFWFLMQKWFKPVAYRPTALKINPADSTVYVIDDGKKWPVTGAGFTAWGFRWADVTNITEQELALPTGTVWTELALGGDGTVFYIENGLRRPLTSPRLMSRYSFSWGTVQRKPESILSNVPYGLPMHELVLPVGDGTVYLATAGILYPVSGPIYGDAWKFAWSDTARVPAYVTERLGAGPLMSNLVIADGGDGTAYYIDWGTAYKVSGPVAQAWGFNLSTLRTVGPALIADQRQGGNLTTLARRVDGDGTIFLIRNGTKQPMTGAYFSRQGYSLGDVRILGPQLDKLPTGSTLR